MLIRGLAIDVALHYQNLLTSISCAHKRYNSMKYMNMNYFLRGTEYRSITPNSLFDGLVNKTEICLFQFY